MAGTRRSDRRLATPADSKKAFSGSAFPWDMIFLQCQAATVGKSRQLRKRRRPDIVANAFRQWN